MPGIGEAFAKGALIKVILDVTNGYAYIQNAGTNSYIESTKATAPMSVSGSVIAVKDSIAAPLHGLTLYGKTTQDGTPTPENPVELVSAGNGGVIHTTITGKNLIDISEAIVKDAEGSYYYSFTGFESNFTPKKSLFLVGGVEYTLSFKNNGADAVGYLYLAGETQARTDIGSNATVFTFTPSVSEYYSLHLWRSTASYEGTISDVQLERGTVTAYEPYEDKTIAVFTPNGLNSIGGVKDEIDFARGVRVQRVKGVREFSFSAWDAEKCIYVARANLSGVNNNTMCNMYQYSALPVADLPHGTYKKSGEYVYLRDTRYTTANEINAALNGLLVILGELATPIETPLSAEELAQYAALRTNKPYTTVTNDAGADMDVSYSISNAAVPIEAGTGNEGKFLRVVNGVAAWVTVNSAEGGSF